MENLRHSAANGGEDTYDVLYLPTFEGSRRRGAGPEATRPSDERVGTSIAEAAVDTGLLESMQPTLGDDVNYYLEGGCEREKMTRASDVPLASTPSSTL